MSQEFFNITKAIMKMREKVSESAFGMFPAEMLSKRCVSHEGDNSQIIEVEGKPVIQITPLLLTEEKISETEYKITVSQTVKRIDRDAKKK